jgi:hypothetical protein
VVEHSLVGLGGEGANYEYQFEVTKGTDTIIGSTVTNTTGSPIQTDYQAGYYRPSVGTVSAITLLGDGTSAGASGTGWTQFVLAKDAAPTDYVALGAIFYVEREEDPDTQVLAMEIKARMWNVNDFTGNSNPFDGLTQDIIPLAVATFDTGNTGLYDYSSGFQKHEIIQLTYNHVLNQFPLGCMDVDGGRSSMRYRGHWNDTDTQELTGQFFYDGDVVTVPMVDAALPEGTLTGRVSLLHVGYSVEDAQPEPTGGNWIPLTPYISA